MKFQRDKTEQPSFLFSRGYRDLLSKEDEIWKYFRLFDSLDLSEFEKKYVGEGQVPIEPKLMLRTIFFGLQKGMVSIRKLSEACCYDLRYIVLSGSLRPDRRTWDRFFIRHEKALEVFFKQITEKAVSLELVGFEHLAIDGTRLKANTKITGMTYDKMTRAKEYIAENLKKLRDDVEKEGDEARRKESEEKIEEEEARIEKMERAQKQMESEDKKLHRLSKIRKSLGERKKSLNDPEALEMAPKGAKGYMFGYNAQIAVDGKSQIILAAGIHSKVTDYEALEGLLDQAEKHTGQKAKHVLCDQGYTSIGNVCMVFEKEMEPIFATARNFEYTTESKEPPRVYEQFTLESQTDTYACLAGHALKAKRGAEATLLSLPTHCQECPLKKDCLFYQKGKKTASAPLAEQFFQMREHLMRSKTDIYKEIYRKRKAIVEPVFGNMKHNKRFTINAVGRAKVGVRFLCMCIAHNLEKILNRGPEKILEVFRSISWTFQMTARDFRCFLSAY